MAGAAAAAYAMRSGAAILAPAVLPQAARAAPQQGEPLVQPLEIHSENGLLEATITAAPGRVQLGDFVFPGYLYNGAYLPPLLRPRLGDTMRITFKNNLADDPSNLHFHGMSVSPQGNSDNVFVHVHPGHQFEYEVRIPATGRQRPGLFWYHPHAHGVVAKQMLGGMSGGLVVDGFENLFPIVRGLRERFLLIKHAEPDDDTEIISINSQLNPVVQIRPGEMQFWRIANIGATLFIKFRIEGMPLYVVATDILGRGRARRPSSSSGPVSESMRSQLVQLPANTPCEPFRFKTKRGKSPLRRSNWRLSSPTEQGRQDRMPKPRSWVSMSWARAGSMRCGPPRSPADGHWNIQERPIGTPS